MRRKASTWISGASCALVLIALGCSGESNSVLGPSVIVGSGIIVSEPRTLPAFHSVNASITETEIVITQAGAQSVQIETDDNIIDEIEMYVSGGVLIIESQATYDTAQGVRIFIDMTDVQSLQFSGFGTMSASGISSGGDLSVAMTGVGNMTLSGAVDTYHGTLEGVGGIDAEALQTRESTIDLIGVGPCRITVAEKLTATISGEGNIYYAGHPPIVIRSITGHGALIQI